MCSSTVKRADREKALLHDPPTTQPWPVHLLLSPTAPLTDGCFSLPPFWKNKRSFPAPPTQLCSLLPGAIYRRTYRSSWTPPKASATRCCSWIFWGDFQTAGSETDEKKPNKTVKGTCSLVIVRKNICLYLVACDLAVRENVLVEWIYISSVLFYFWVVYYLIYIVCSWVLPKNSSYYTHYF